MTACIETVPHAGGIVELRMARAPVNALDPDLCGTSSPAENTAFDVDRSGRTITESFAVTLRNAKAADATVRVVEPLPRWSDWEIVESSVPAERQDARHAVFEVPVPAGGEARLTYTVRYRWARDVAP